MKNFPIPPYHNLCNGVPNALYITMLEGVDFHCNVIDTDYKIIWHNRMAEERRKPGFLCYEFYLKRNEPCVVCPVRNVFGSGEISLVERKRLERLPNGLPTWGEIRAFPIFGKNGDVEAVLTIGFDITEKHLQFEMQRRDIAILRKRSEELAKWKSITPADERKMTFHLTNRELQVLNLLAQGFSNPEISQILSLSAHTVKTHV